MKIKAFFIDLDDTLLVEQEKHVKYIPDYNVKALDKLLATGVKVVIASGRSLDHMTDWIKDDWDYDFDRVGSNGATVYCQGNIISEYRVSSEKLLAVVEFMKDVKTVELFIGIEEGKLYFLRLDSKYVENFRGFLKERSEDVISKKNILDTLKDKDIKDPLKMCILTENFVMTKKWTGILKQHFSEHLDFFNSSESCIEVMAKDVNKGRGMRDVCDHYGWSINEVAAIGDAENDISMLKLTPYSYAMINAQMKVKQAANKVVENVAEAITEVIAINS